MPQFILDLVFGNFVKGLSEFGYEQGRNVDVIKRFDMFTDRVATMEEMVALIKPDVIVAPATLQAVEARKATSTIPIVCGALADAVHLGLIASEARPGGNVTGIEPYISGLPTKQIELAREIAPTARCVGLLTNMNDPKGPPQVGDLKAACQAIGLSVVEADANTPNDIPGALAALANEKVDVVVVLQTNLLLVQCEQIGAIALEKRIPTVFGYREHVIHGGLVSYGVDLRWCYRRVGYFVDKILRGARPADRPRRISNEVLVGRQSQDGKGSRRDRTGRASRARRRVDRVRQRLPGLAHRVILQWHATSAAVGAKRTLVFLEASLARKATLRRAPKRVKRR
ncbi:MAG TPA: ABC transporter substrate-binding protein, partial [Bradyrhizobium sp.]|nr:ABC transporter substrate-binding protein [Bradyrhizobium sp.]